jgi:chromosome segregation ATPase
MQDPPDSADCADTELAAEILSSDDQPPAGSADRTHYLRERVHIATLQKEMENVEKERDEFARQVTELEEERDQLEDEVARLEGIIERKDEQLEQVISNYETVIDHKHQQIEGAESTSDTGDSQVRSRIHRMFGWIR